MSDDHALAWAHEWGCNAIYKQVPVGGKFQFRSTEHGIVAVKGRYGYRLYASDGTPLPDFSGVHRQYRTGARTAVKFLGMAVMQGKRVIVDDACHERE